MENVVALRPSERFRHDSGAISAIYRNLGPVSAERMVARTLADLALTMAGLTVQVEQHQLGDVARHLRRLQQIGDHLGMVTLARVALDLRLCLDSADVTAFSAIWARLLRIAEQALTGDQPMLDQSPV